MTEAPPAPRRRGTGGRRPDFGAAAYFRSPEKYCRCAAYPMLLSKLPDVGVSIFSQMTLLAQQTGALNLAQGFPDYDPPLALREALARHALASGQPPVPRPCRGCRACAPGHCGAGGPLATRRARARCGPGSDHHGRGHRGALRGAGGRGAARR
ncbi:MAG: hypothetical protein WKG07_25465 [Hymenobacter sp.]